MGCKIRDHRRFDNTRGVSEIIGAVLLITLVVAAVSVVAVILFSQPTPKEVPNLNFMTGMNTSLNTLYLYHNGGDPLNAGEFSVLVDGVPKAYTISGGGSQWSLGKNLVVPISPAHVPDRVQIIYNGTSMGGGSVGSGVVLREASSTNIVNSANISADIAPYLDCSAVRNWACADQIPPEIIVAEFMKNSSVKKINFMQLNQNRGAIVGGAGYHLNFTVSKDNSSIILGNDQCTSTTNFVLKANDRVNVTFDVAPDRFTVYGMAPQIWMMVGGGPSRITTTITNISGTYVYTNVLNARAICGAWIQGYSELDSTINIQTINTGEMTSLIVNDTIYVQSPSATSFTFTNVQPIGNGMFLVTYTSNQAPLYMIGWADTVKFNGVTQTGLGL